MAKTFANVYDKKVYAFRRWFKGKRAMCNLTLIDLGRKMGKSHTSISRKVNPKGDNQSDITYQDLLLFFKEVHATDEEILHYMKV